jgi:formylglycine-generating enzyme required for sulfatase activity
MRLQSALTFVALVCAIACASTPTTIVTLRTDVPLGPGEPWGSPRLFETLSLRVLSGSCTSCSRDFSLTKALFQTGEETFRVEGENPLVVATLSRRRQRQNARPERPFTVQGGALLELSYRSLIGATDLALAAWRGRIPCAALPREGEACVPGGLVWVGDEQLDLSGAIELRGREERLVILSPFYLQTREITVAEFRNRIPSFGGKGVFRGAEESARCNFTPEPGRYENYAMNCVTGDAAEAYCRSLGMELPTEAQFEYVMGNGVGDRFPWSAESAGEAVCADAVFGGSKCGRERPMQAGSAPRDRVRLPDGSVVLDLAGNVGEWMRDSFVEAGSDPCIPLATSENPLCRRPEKIGNEMRSVRGADFDVDALYMASAIRRFTPVRSLAPNLGFRCARDR